MAKVATCQERLKELFDADPRTDSAIALALGVSKQAVSAWRHGVRSPKKSTVLKLAEFYNVSEEWIFGWDLPHPPFASSQSQPFHESVIAMLDNVIDERNADAALRGKIHSDGLGLLKTFESLSEEGRAYLLQQADIAKKMFSK